MLARLRFNQLLGEHPELESECCQVGTIHDSIVVDCSEKTWYNICLLLKQAIEDVPGLVQKLWKYNFVLPLTCEVQAGPTKLEMKEVNFAN